ncbi:digestive cysteine proteinase 2-like [Anticarsia gemmatalis]|uniref:digestive cysteine proteinase 2-like n=1 Tax=Anticarsia gemmatalis TaxID=129554 RepID=UPI003F75D94B
MSPIWILLGVAALAQAHVVKKHDFDPEYTMLEWPAQFTLKAIRTSLTDNVVENYEIWRTSKLSRIDYNEGYVKSIVKSGKPYRYGIKYAIHPEADRDQETTIVCSNTEGNRYSRQRLETILPEDPESYDLAGTEESDGIEYLRFVYDYSDETTDRRNTIWAIYDEQNEIWIPSRYEVIEFNLWLGSKDKHEIWDFFDFSSSFSYRRVFDVSTYDCPDELETPTYANNSEAMKKNLMFVDPEKPRHVSHVFNVFKKDFGKSYSDKKEHLKRKSIFKKNLRRIVQHNRRNLGYKLAVNQFADKTPEEMKKYMGLNRRPEGKVGNIPFPYDDRKLEEAATELPVEYDARLLGLVSKVKNQEECGSCWTFGTTAAAEGALARINGGRLLTLSNQALVDCAWAFGAAGCDGGTDNAAYEWMMQYGLPTEAEYGSYLNQDGPCRILNMTELHPIKGFTDVTPLSVSALKLALINHGPLSVSVHVTDAFSYYSSGIFYDTECNELNLNHEVTLVGYGERDGDTYWILKNSWGPNWGIGGYMYISSRDNNCGVATEPTYVVF